MEHVCPDCNRGFQTAESLAQHKVAKHTVQATVAKKKGFPVKLVGGVLILLAIIGFAVLSHQGSQPTDKPLIDTSQYPTEPGLQKMMDVNLAHHTGDLALHIHPWLAIQINGQPQVLSANIGINNKGVMRVMHTHDTSGEIHIESPAPYQFHLKDFFTVWGKNLNDTCIFDYCADATHTLSVYVNGVKTTERPGLVPLRDHDQLLISYDEIKPVQ